ncbi:Golgi Apparatus Protein 1 [Manis pentadactyla]|nr:Golgi Apparatus Protein 1 [Manis pentadactyla]
MRLDFGSYSDVSEGQIDLDHHGVALVTSMLTLRSSKRGSCLGVGVFNVEADGKRLGRECEVEVTGLRSWLISMAEAENIWSMDRV